MWASIELVLNIPLHVTPCAHHSSSWEMNIASEKDIRSKSTSMKILPSCKIMKYRKTRPCFLVFQNIFIHLVTRRSASPSLPSMGSSSSRYEEVQGCLAREVAHHYPPLPITSYPLPIIRFQFPIAHHIHYPAWAVAAADMRRSKDALQKKLAILGQATTDTVFNLA